MTTAPRSTRRRAAIRDDGPIARSNARLRAALEDAETVLAAAKPGREVRIGSALAIIRNALEWRGEP